MRRMNILVLNWKDVANPEAGGAEVFIQEVAARWVRQGLRVTMIARLFPGAKPTESIDGVEVVRLGGRFTVYRQARAWYRKNGKPFDAIFETVSTRPFFPHLYPGTPASVSLFHQTATEIWSYEFPKFLAWAGRYVLEPKWLRRYGRARVIAYSKSTADDLRSRGVRRIDLIPIGATVPVTPPNVDKAPAPTILFVARMAANKRPDHALMAWRLARREIPDLQLWMVGDGPMAKTLDTGEAGVEFLGNVSNEEKFSKMAAAHVLVATSVREGWGMTVTEAAAMGTLPIGYSVPGLRDSVKAASGRLVEPNPVAMAAAVVEAIESGEALAFKSVPAPSWDDTAAACLQYLESAVRGKRA